MLHHTSFEGLRLAIKKTLTLTLSLFKGEGNELRSPHPANFRGRSEGCEFRSPLSFRGEDQGEG